MLTPVGGVNKGRGGPSYRIGDDQDLLSNHAPVRHHQLTSHRATGDTFPSLHTDALRPVCYLVRTRVVTRCGSRQMSHAQFHMIIMHVDREKAARCTSTLHTVNLAVPKPTDVSELLSYHGAKKGGLHCWQLLQKCYSSVSCCRPSPVPTRVCVPRSVHPGGLLREFLWEAPAWIHRWTHRWARDSTREVSVMR